MMSRATGDDDAGFDEYAATYESALAKGLAATGEGREYYARERAWWVARALEPLGVRPRTILDYGCGTGAATPFLLAAFPDASLVGVDVSLRSLTVARETIPSPRARFASVDEFSPPGDVDLAYCNGVFHHVPRARRDLAVAYVHASLRPGGVFAFWENNPWNPGTRYVMRRIPFDRDAETLSPPASRALLRRGGFEILATDFRFFFPRWLGMLRGLESSVLRRVPLGGQYMVLCRKAP